MSADLPIPGIQGAAKLVKSLSTVNDTTGRIITPSIGITNAPTASTDGVNKQYVDSLISGLTFKSPCATATVGNLTATYANGTSGVGATLTNSSTLAALTVDGQALSVGNRLLVKNQSTNAQNGIYSVTIVGTGSVAWVLTRTTDYDTAAEIVPGSVIPVDNGTVNANTIWLQTETVTTVGTSAIGFSSFGYGTVTSVATGTGLSGGPITTTGTIGLANTVVTPGSYTNASITVDAQGRLTSAATGTTAVTSVTNSGTNIVVAGTSTAPTVALATTLTGLTAVTASGTIKANALQSTGDASVAGTLVIDSISATGTLSTTGTVLGATLASNGDITAADDLVVTGDATAASYQIPANGHVFTLNANGAQSADLTITFPTAAGSNGQLLSTTGSGNLAWTSAATGTVTSVIAGAGLSGGTITGTGTISMPNTGTAGATAYPASITTDAQGRVTATTAGTAPVTSVTNSGSNIAVGGTSTAPTVALATTLTGLTSVTSSDLVLSANGHTLTLTGSSALGSDTTLTFPAVSSKAGYTLVTSDTSGTLGWSLAGSGTVTSITSPASTLTVGGTSSVPTIDLTSIVSGASYTNASITIDEYGRVTAASSGTAPVTSVTQGSNISVTGTTTPTVALSSTLTGLTSIGTGSVTATGTVQGATLTSTGGITAATTIIATGAIRGATLNIPANSNTLTLAGSSSQSADVTLTFPIDAGSNNQVLKTNGSGVLAWTSAATGTVTSVIAGTGLSGGTITSTGTVSMPNVGTPSTTAYPGSITTDAQGRVSGLTAGFVTDTQVSGAATVGTATLDGTDGVVVNTTAVATGSIILVTRNSGTSAPSLGATVGILAVGSIVAGTSFTIYSTVALDTDNANWVIINP